MGDFQYFDIILFAMIAAFLVLRLRSVLGRRTGNERRRDLFPPRPARVAFEIIVTAFAKGDKAALRPLLSDDVFRPFAQTIDERATAKETVETRGLKLDEAEIVEADLYGRTARITVRLVSHQITVTRAMDGSIVDGDPDHPVEKTDYWTFARDTRSSDPNWTLVATSSG